MLGFKQVRSRRVAIDIGDLSRRVRKGRIAMGGRDTPIDESKRIGALWAFLKLGGLNLHAYGIENRDGTITILTKVLELQAILKFVDEPIRDGITGNEATGLSTMTNQEQERVLSDSVTITVYDRDVDVDKLKHYLSMIS